MITLSTFQKRLSDTATQPEPSSKHIKGQKQQLLQWAAGLSVQTEAQQAHQLEEVLNELAVTDLADERRLHLMDIVVTATDRLVTSLHKHYIYELGALIEEQIKYLDQVKSLYYLTILVYDGVVNRQRMFLEQQHARGGSSAWRRLLSLPKATPLTLAAAIYQTLATYRKLIYEKSTFYQALPTELWGSLNKLYYLACEYHVADTDLSSYVVTRQASTIHKLYLQLCLHSLLNVRTLRRPSILMVQRLIPLWAQYISATKVPDTQTRMFIDLCGDSPPDYYSASSSVNPYDENYNCLFIDIELLAEHLKHHQQSLLDKNHETVESRLVTKVLMMLDYRYLHRQTAKATKVSPKLPATLVTGFNDIHYCVAGEIGLMSLIDAPTLALEQRPRHDTRPKKDESITMLEVETFDSTDNLSHFRTLRLLSKQDLFTKKMIVDDKLSKPASALQSLESLSLTQVQSNTAPPLLRMMKLFLLCRPHNKNKLKWSLGIVRWLNLESENKQSNRIERIEVEWQVLGHGLTACALRLDSSDKLDSRGQHFVPAFIIEEDSDLQTESSLLVPPYLFHTHDKVIVRIGNTQTALRLEQSLLNTEEFIQYKVVQV